MHRHGFQFQLLCGIEARVSGDNDHFAVNDDGLAEAELFYRGRYFFRGVLVLLGLRA